MLIVICMLCVVVGVQDALGQWIWAWHHGNVKKLAFLLLLLKIPVEQT